MLHQQIQEIDPVHCSELSSTGRFYSPKSLLLMKESSKVWGRDFSSSCPFQASDIWFKNEALETFLKIWRKLAQLLQCLFPQVLLQPRKKEEDCRDICAVCECQEGVRYNLQLPPCLEGKPTWKYDLGDFNVIVIMYIKPCTLQNHPIETWLIVLTNT